MKRLLSVFGVTTGLLALSLLSACSLMNQSWSGHGKVAPVALVPPAPPPPPIAPPPEATFKFTLEPHQDVVGVLQKTVVGKEDTLTDIARRFNVGYEELLRANPGVDPWLPGAGRTVLIPTRFVLPDAPRSGVVINIAAMRLYYFPRHKPGEKQVVYTHPIGIGKVGWSTPEGTTRILRRQKNPTWRPPLSVIKEHRQNGDVLPAVVGPGPDNPLGHYAFYLAWPGYLIHGTNKPAGVGLRSSHGCIRLFPEDIAELFDMVPIGTKVHVVNQPFVFGWDQDRLVMQAYGSLEDSRRDWKKAQAKLRSKSLGPTLQRQLKRHGQSVDWTLVLQLAHAPLGVVVPVNAADAGQSGSELAGAGTADRAVGSPGEAEGGATQAAGALAGAGAGSDTRASVAAGVATPTPAVGDDGAAAAVSAVVASAVKVQDRVPDGATWDGKTDLPMDDKTFDQVMGDVDPADHAAPVNPHKAGI